MNNISYLVAEIVRIKSMMQSRNYLIHEFRETVKRHNDRDIVRIENLRKRIKFLKKERGRER